MATISISGNNTTRNNGGTVLHGGNIPSSASWNNLTVKASAVQGKVGARITSDMTGVDQVNGSANFATMEENKYIGVFMSGGTLGGVANTRFNKAASDVHRRGVHSLQTSRRLDHTSWDYVTGAVTKGGNAGDSYNYINPSVAGGTTASDDTAVGTRALPGEFVYVLGKNVVLNDYPAKTS